MEKLKNNFFQAYFAMPVPRIIVRTDCPEYTILSVNTAFETLMGQAAEQAAGKSIFQLFQANPPSINGNDLLSDALEKATDTNNPIEIPKLEMAASQSNGTLTWYHIELLPVAETNEKPGYLIITTRDITQTILNQLELEEASYREQTLHEELAATNEELLASNEELSTTIEDLKQSRESLQELNDELEKRVMDRTAELMLAQVKLKEKHALLDTIINEVPAGICVFDGPEMKMEMANKKLLNLWKRDESIMGMPLIEIMPELKEQAFPRLLHEVYTTGIAHSETDARAELLVEGIKRVVYRDFSYTPIKRNDGSTQSIVALTIDVTERSLARLREQQLIEELSATNEELSASNEELATTNEELNEAHEMQRKLISNLEQSELRFRMAIEAAQMGSWHIERKTKALLYNETLAKLFGYEGKTPMTYDQAIAQVTEDCKEKLLAEIEKAIEDGGEYDVTYAQRRFNDGEVIWLRSLGRVTPDEYGNFSVFSGVVMDITEQKEDEQRKNDFIGMVSHELKTPLTSLKGYAQILHLKAKKNQDDFALSALAKVIDQIKKMTGLINGFLDISRLESGKIHLDKSHFNLDELILENIEETSLLNTSHHIIFNACPQVSVIADRDKISSVISNIIGNAVKYAPEQTEIEINCELNDTHARITVKDQGTGIAEKDVEKLFDRFYRVESEQTQLISGFGIGLYLCAEIIERHHGTIGVESKIGVGSTFYFTLPIANQPVA
ncbi:ATP-binding protein [Pedobacter sp. MC2016-24]|uniref:ATP-binding protein n=1 Tax=Pedobacter sp. MC2016-24 TaxID=2780090 RepID=UPI0018806312|nr:ATP-binding protein [Pedobacter sp. MC2016-24]MBE9602219.1 PAS domain S-box protein [Pedobacter sp. MC2016-24]